MQLVAVWQHGSNSNIKIVHNSIEYFLWNLYDFSFDDVLSCLIVFTNSVFQVYSPSENSQVGWDLGNRMARGYWFDVKCVFPGGSYTWGIQVFCLRNKVVPHFLNRTLEYLRHNFPWERLISRQTNNPGHPICKISTHLTIFWGGTWKTRVCENNQTREDIIRRQIRWIPLEMLNRVVDNFNVQVAAVLCVCVRVCVCVCVCVCVYVCVCLYSSTCWFLLAAQHLWHTWEVRINDLLLWVFWELLPSSFISISESILFHLQRWKLQPTTYWRERDMI